MNQENVYPKGCEVKYLLKSKTSVDLVEFNSQSLKGVPRSIPKALDAATP